jgi:hypothetical protein
LLNLQKTNYADVAEAGYEFELKLPGSGEGTGAFIKVRGDQSKAVRSWSRRKATEFQMKSLKGKDKDKPMSVDEVEDFAIEQAVNRIISWRGFTEDDVNEIPFTPENAERILKENPWIREQVMEEAQELLNFLPK